MTDLVDRPLVDGSTLSPKTAPHSPSDQAAKDFYLSGSGGNGRLQLVIQGIGPDGSLRRTWLAAHTEEQVNSLLRLQAGWDGRRASPLTVEAVSSAVDLLFTLASDLSLAPQMFPLPDGGLQMEWHAGRSIEIEVDATGAAHLLVADEGGILTNEALVPGDQGLLARARRALEELSVSLTRVR